MLIAVQVKLLQHLIVPTLEPGTAHETVNSVSKSLGAHLLRSAAGKVVIDFGCGEGDATVELALGGARRVIGIDIREEVLRVARLKAAASGVGHICYFTSKTEECADVIISLDAFEHFAEPAAVLELMSRLLKPGGEVLVSFGPTWYHPKGGHLFSVFPWAHLLLSEEALIRWRSGFKTDGATRFGQVAGGLNQMTIRRFEELVAASSFQFSSFETVPIRKLRWLHRRRTREFTTAMVRCRLATMAFQG